MQLNFPLGGRQLGKNNFITKLHCVFVRQIQALPQSTFTMQFCGNAVFYVSPDPVLGRKNEAAPSRAPAPLL
jgi:hypothetical protein